MSETARLMRSGEQFVAARNWSKARDAFERVAANEENADALIHLSYIDSQEGHYRAARDFALRALRAGPRSPGTVVKLLSRLRNFNQTWAIHQLVREATELEKLEPKLLHAVSAQLSYIGEQQEAKRFLDLALSRAPASPPLLLARGQINTFLGLFDEAEKDLEQCLMYAPAMGGAWWTLSRVRKQTASANHVDALRRHLAAAPSPIERGFLAYALHKELDDLGDIVGACEALTVACKARRAEARYDERQTQKVFDGLKRLPLEAMHDAPAKDYGFTPVFIVGMFRSGTTLLEQLMGANPMLLNAGELYDITSSMRYATDYHSPTLVDLEMIRRAPRTDFSEVAENYVRGVSWRLSGQTHLTDKLPPNFLNVAFICKAFPQAKLIHMVRDPVETCFSNLRESFSKAGAYSYDQRDLGGYYRNYQLLMEHWKQAFPGRILDVHYSELTTSTERVVRQVAGHCGLDFLPAMVDPQSRPRSVATASAVQVRSPVIARAVPKWEPYRAYLEPLITTLEKNGALALYADRD